MLRQIKKIVHCHFPDLSGRLRALPDARSRREYTIEELVMAGVMLFLFKSDSRNDMDNQRKDQTFACNYHQVFHLRLPSMEAVDDLLEVLSNDELERLKAYLVCALIEKKVFHRFRFLGRWLVGVDATGVYNWGDVFHEFALHKTSGKGKTTYFSNLLEAKLITSTGITITLASEWIYNGEGDYDKQDCEQSAFKRLAVTLKGRFPRLPVCILADGLYPNEPFMDICKENGWQFIAVLKDGSLPSVWQEVELLPDNDRAFHKRHHSFCSKTHRTTMDYKWTGDIEYRTHRIRWVECLQKVTCVKTAEEVQTRFVYITNVDVDADNIIQFVDSARCRWHIEDSFNTQKHRGYVLHHKFNRDDFQGMKNWHSLRNLAHIICQLVEKSVEIQALLTSKETIKNLWRQLLSYFTMTDIDANELAWLEQTTSRRMQVRLC